MAHLHVPSTEWGSSVHSDVYICACHLRGWMLWLCLTERSPASTAEAAGATAEATGATAEAAGAAVATPP